MVEFWKEILKMDFLPLLITVSFAILFRLFDVEIHSWSGLLGWICVYLAIYIPTFFHFSMNQSERDLIFRPVHNMINRMKSW